MQSDTSLRDKTLSTSSPFLTLVIILAVIIGLLLIVFISWVRFRKRGSDIGQRTVYGRLVEEDIIAMAKARVDDGWRQIDPSEQTELELGSRSPPDVALPEQVAKCNPREGANVAQSNMIQRSPEAPRSLDRAFAPIEQDLSIEALIATHRRLMEQRERFISDSRNVGLRHMALEHLKMQQRYEKQIMELKVRSIKSS